MANQLTASRQRVYTTGQVARLCQVAPRTAAKWIDSGLLRGYRIPGSQDRRVTHEALVDFMERSGMSSLLCEQPVGAPC